MKYPALKFTLRNLSHDLELNESYGKLNHFYELNNKWSDSRVGVASSSTK